MPCVGGIVVATLNRTMAIKCRVLACEKVQSKWK
jgi:hypothetical protein